MRKFFAFFLLILNLLNTPQVSYAMPDDDKILLQSNFQNRDFFLFFMILIDAPFYFRQTADHFNSFYRAIIEDSHREPDHERDIWMQHSIGRIRARMASHLKDYHILLESNTVTGLITNHHITYAIDELHRIFGNEEPSKEEEKEESKEEEKQEIVEENQMESLSPRNYFDDFDFDALDLSVFEPFSTLERQSSESESSSSSSSSNPLSDESSRRNSINPGFYVYSLEADIQSPPWLVPRELMFIALFMNQHILPAFLNAHMFDTHIYALRGLLSSYELNEARLAYENYVQYINLNPPHSLYESGVKRSREEDYEIHAQPFVKRRASEIRPVYIIQDQWIPREEIFNFFENIDERTMQIGMQGGHFLSSDEMDESEVEHINIGISFESSADRSVMRSGIGIFLSKLTRYPNLKRITVSVGSHAENLQFLNTIQGVLLHPNFIANLRVAYSESIEILRQRVEFIEIRNLGVIPFVSQMQVGYPNFMTFVSNFQNLFSALFGSSLSMREFFPVRVQYISGLGGVYYHKLVFYFN